GRQQVNVATNHTGKVVAIRKEFGQLKQVCRYASSRGGFVNEAPGQRPWIIGNGTWQCDHVRHRRGGAERVEQVSIEFRYAPAATEAVSEQNEQVHEAIFRE